MTLDETYSFSDSFKLEDIFLKAVLKKYKEEVNGKDFHTYLYPLRNERLDGQRMSWLKNCCRVLDIPPHEVLLYITERGNNVLITKNRLCSVKEKNTFIPLEDSFFYGDDTVGKRKAEIGEDKINVPSYWMNCIKELSILNTPTDDRVNTHPFIEKEPSMRRSYLNKLITFVCSEGTLAAEQIMRIEQLARQFQIPPFQVLGDFKQALADNSTAAPKVILLNEIKTTHEEKIALTDFILLDLIGTQWGKAPHPLNDTLYKQLDSSKQHAKKVRQNLKEKLGKV
jgi:hypothetical protein